MNPRRSRARDAMPGGGRLTIETANRDLNEEEAGQHGGVPAGPYVMLSVSDTGTGMDPETVARAFEPFFTTKEAGQGTGLGLAMVYGIVKQSGGDIRVVTELGHGTAFRIYFPRLEAAEETVMESPPFFLRPLGTGSETILVLEDETAYVASSGRSWCAADIRFWIQETRRKQFESAKRGGKPSTCSSPTSLCRE